MLTSLYDILPAQVNSIAGKAQTMVDGGSKRSVAVIGAGMAGIAAGRVLRDEGLDVTIFESSNHVGGVWRYGPSCEGGAMCEFYRFINSTG